MTATITDAIGALPEACEFVRGRAAALDRVETTARVDVAKLGELGLFAPGCPGRPLSEMVTVIEQIAQESLAAGFSAWAHRMALEYVARGPETARQKFGTALESGSAVGVTAMAAGLKHCAGLGELSLVAEPSPGGITVTGPIRWASNLFDDALIVFCARSAADDARYVAVTPIDAPGVTVKPAPDLLALGGTASSSLEFAEVFVPSEAIITADLRGFVRQVRPAFLLLQTAFCLGIAGTAVQECGRHLDGLGACFTGEHAELAHGVSSARERLYRFAEAVSSVERKDDPDPAARQTAGPSDGELIRLRLDGSQSAMAATRLEVTLRGGAGYATASATNRRFREAAFLPVQSPSEGQLRWELERSN
ncbi:acyl-CoA dehydrogenase family protein [Tomitella gaofuii]|uniref:acyl-CoA dehydrogenase family protein n=1 Tax=Tomitella gaofuii TaxID=2760083 RepID=UPI001F485B8B|nr:acyl-CoA dehydrogenase family protein [Tomitella gaofuii]